MKWLGIAVVATATAITGVLSAGFEETAEPAPFISWSPPPSGPTTSVILVTLDGVRAKEIFQGADPSLAGRGGLPGWARGGAERFLPNIHRLFMKTGAALGEPRHHKGISATGPHYVSLPGYLEIMTGMTATCRVNDCVPKPAETIADAVAADAGSPGASLIFSSWEVIARAASDGTHGKLVDVHAGRDALDTMSSHPGNEPYRPDAATWTRAMEAIEKGRPRFLWISLGDTDEWAHQHDYIGYLGAIREADRHLGELASRLSKEGAAGEGTMLIVTTDHGRDENFADHGEGLSAPVWMLARGPEVAVTGSIEARRPRYLKDIAPTIRSVLGLPQRTCDGCGEVIEEILRPERDTASKTAAYIPSN